MPDHRIDQPLRLLVLYQPLEHKQVGNAGPVSSRSVKIRRPGNGGRDIAFTDLTHQLSRYAGPEVSFTAAGIVRSFFRHSPSYFSVHIYVVKKDQPRPRPLAGLDRIVNDPGPLLPPNGIVIFEAHTKINHGRPLTRLKGLIRVGEIGCQDSSPLPEGGKPGYQSYRQLMKGQFFGQTVGDDAASTQNSME